MGIETILLDVTDERSISEAVKKVTELTRGELNFLINNSGMAWFTVLIVSKEVLTLDRLQCPSSGRQHEGYTAAIRTQRFRRRRSHSSFQPAIDCSQGNIDQHRICSWKDSNSLARIL